MCMCVFLRLTSFIVGSGWWRSPCCGWGDGVVGVDDASDSDRDAQCDGRGDDDLSVDPPSLESEPDERPTRERRAPERYNPSSGGNYVQSCHHIMTQRHPAEKTLEYEPGEVQVVANIIAFFNGTFYVVNILLLFRYAGRIEVS